jgi:hypothetical protein
MHLFNVDIELNRVIHYLCKVCGIELGIMLGLMLPAACLTYLFYKLNFTVGFALLVGFRIKLFINQLQSFKLEKLILAQLGGRGAPPSSAENAGSQPDNSKTAPKISPEDK